ncbi:head decoration protein [Pseudomonas sp. CCC3.2]|uniref:head decoration protein n=1 Tax=unclassified Pseudomonas TaxID=196821 RepID=UPI002AB4B1B2|nr:MULTISPECIES: head decoration protein [unclassified Pseudomonas]MDY7560212.1 head decoration protein [Pseudomonas sp. AB6]MEB0178761.1 head decoration protein [Pseudomonas sp. CCC3.2]MEB0211399.1 head decoration protein [Pseudomonas sp. AB6]
MSLTPSSIRDNPQQPGVQAQVYIPDQLIADARNLVTQPILLGAGVLQRGTVLGQQTVNPFQATASSSNTGNGTLGGISVGTAVEIGGYVLLATSATTFSVTDPEGVLVGNATVGTAFTNIEINFTLTAGGTAFAVGDTFTINVFDVVGTYIQCVRTASDGSQLPVAVLVDYADASAGAVTTGAYLAGELNVAALIYDASWSLPGLVSAMRPYGLFAKTSVSAAPPSNNPAP